MQKPCRGKFVRNSGECADSEKTSHNSVRHSKLMNSVTRFASSIPNLLAQLRKEGNAGFDKKGQWPNIDVSEVDEILGKVPGANGDADKGEAIMIANAKKLPSQKHPKAPDRIDMPVIDAKKGDLTRVLKMIANGEIDISTGQLSHLARPWFVGCRVCSGLHHYRNIHQIPSDHFDKILLRYNADIDFEFICLS